MWLLAGTDPEEPEPLVHVLNKNINAQNLLLLCEKRESLSKNSHSNYQ